MKIIKLIIAIAIFSSHTLNAVWYKPWTWFSSTEEMEYEHDHNHDHDMSDDYSH